MSDSVPGASCSHTPVCVCELARAPKKCMYKYTYGGDKHENRRRKKTQLKCPRGGMKITGSIKCTNATRLSVYIQFVRSSGAVHSQWDLCDNDVVRN